MNRLSAGALLGALALTVPAAHGATDVVATLDGETVSVTFVVENVGSTTSLNLYRQIGSGDNVAVGNTTPDVPFVDDISEVSVGTVVRYSVNECFGASCGPLSNGTQESQVVAGGGDPLEPDREPMPNEVTGITAVTTDVPGEAIVRYTPVTVENGVDGFVADGYNFYLNGTYFSTGDVGTPLEGAITVGIDPENPDDPLNPFIEPGDRIQVVAFDRRPDLGDVVYGPLSRIARVDDTGGGGGECPTADEVAALQAELDAANARIVELEAIIESGNGALSTELGLANDLIAVLEADLVTVDGERDAAVEERDACLAREMAGGEDPVIFVPPAQPEG